MQCVSVSLVAGGGGAAVGAADRRAVGRLPVVVAAHDDRQLSVGRGLVHFRWTVSAAVAMARLGVEARLPRTLPVSRVLHLVSVRVRLLISGFV